MCRLRTILEIRDGWLLALVYDDFSSGSKVPGAVTDFLLVRDCVGFHYERIDVACIATVLRGFTALGTQKSCE